MRLSTTTTTTTTLLAYLATALSPTLCVADASNGNGSGGGLYPPGLLPLINRANALLTAGQYNEATRLYTEAIDQSPSDYLLYYKRATAYFSLSRHAAALDDFDKVLALTGDTFDNAYIMKARIHVREGEWEGAREAVGAYKRAKGKGKEKRGGGLPEAEGLEVDIEEGEKLQVKAEKERRAQLWNACVETTSAALRIASYSIQVREWRTECALAAGDIESAVGDLTRLSHLLPPSTSLLSRIFKLSYFLLPSSVGPQNTLKQCLHYDPDSKPCLTLRRIFKSLDRSFFSLDELINAQDWRGLVQLLTASGKSNNLLGRFDDALRDHLKPEDLLPQSSGGDGKNAPRIPLPDPMKRSPLRQTLIRTLCKAYTNIADASKSDLDARNNMGKWCKELLTLDGCAEDVDGLVGQAESLLAVSGGGEEGKDWEEAARLLEKAFEVSGRGDRKIYQRLTKAQKMVKQSKQKDYYKVLGVARDADDKTIKKAYRRLAKTAHPDKGGSEAKMAALNEAYEVLSNSELRARFDAGDDPNDPMGGHGGPGGGFPFGGATYAFHGGGFGGSGGQQHPFAQFFQQGGGPGGGFKFHFGG
ncbi:hypothetical protein AMATHDRAFT_70891 [Amanita thiersii Skay4041]|uniref:J domain-containing protein n=1 Tax=Amanita thiersii Skay4041 TaxID=703135 RepID=A0A2A9N6V7_9AGAR|nr:hypothetical protein AMATHDRAFT_70891 [Amanita thiersii Skay4041]